MCGILAGNGVASQGKYRGIAPGARLICGKVLDKKGNGCLKNLIMGMNWIINMKEEYPIKILNISIEIGSDNNIDKKELYLLHKYLELIWNYNIITVVASGNSGPASMTLSPISDGGYCICVGCHDDGYIGVNGKNCADYSGRGPGKNHDFYSKRDNPLRKPDVVAPGTDIISCSSKYYISKNKIGINKNWLNQVYCMKSGTSMAVPAVSGACALCLQKYPYLTNNELYRKIIASARDMGECWSVQGAGMLDISRLLSL